MKFKNSLFECTTLFCHIYIQENKYYCIDIDLIKKYLMEINKYID